LKDTIVHVIGRLAIEETALAQEEIRSLGVSEEDVRPGGVAGVKELFPLIAQLKPQGDIANLMGDTKGENSDIRNRRLSVGLEDMKNCCRELFWLCGVPEHRLKKAAHPLFGPRGACHMQRFGARTLIKIFQEKERQPAKMIPMKMA